MSKMYLLGFNNNDEVVLGEFGITTRNGYNEFTACFNTVAPFEVEETNGIEYMEYMLDDCYSDEDKYNLCVRFDCKPSELAEAMAQEEGIYTNVDEKDCSIYTNRIYVDGIEYAFESMGCGQHDIRTEGMKEYVNKEAVEKLLELWDKHHLKKVNDDIIEEVAKLQQLLDIEPAKKESIIASYIEKYML